MTAGLLQPKSPGCSRDNNMNTLNSESSAPRSRRQATLVALLVTLLGVTVLPGFTCTAERDADGSMRGSVQT